VVVVGSWLFLVDVVGGGCGKLFLVVVVVVVGSWLFLANVFSKIFSCSCEFFCEFFCPKLLPVTSLIDDPVEMSERSVPKSVSTFALGDNVSLFTLIVGTDVDNVDSVVVLKAISVASVFAVCAVVIVFVVVVFGGGAAIVVVLIVFIVDVSEVGFSAYLVFLMVALSSTNVLINPLFLAEAACCCDDREPAFAFSGFLESFLGFSRQIP